MTEAASENRSGLHGLTQSTVSHALSALEHELGVTLLERNHKGVVALTNPGQKILLHTRALLAQAEAIEQEAKAARGETSGKLRLGTTLSLCPDVLASVLTRFRASYPHMEVVLFEGMLQEVYKWIESDIIDVGFVLLPASGIESTLITTDELCVLVPPGHRLHAKTAVSAGDLRDEGLIMAKTECSFQMMERAGLERCRSRPPLRYQASDSATILAMVREGLGITLIPRMMLPKKLEGVVALPLDPPQPLQIGLAVRSQEMASRGATLFVQTALAWAQEQILLPPRAC
ncbi:putative HTH-type transcriptional regulator YvbU [Ktedonobacter sp. SOSP1-85]|uniref:LysR family transcriptional regulator n=1 Tax=Ktedonobacter sp. SOSP1-85 TaxID=2778367 RepID=UPI0019154751|nr:LysR family transcriptional regulator [Ktedonobacter sp. SOSP1-85]GHO80278.1 putative HTH-type transcriptional regulator YvbU [Ktedonobacter sp. SOSP1-85]